MIEFAVEDLRIVFTKIPEDCADYQTLYEIMVYRNESIVAEFELSKLTVNEKKRYILLEILAGDNPFPVNTKNKMSSLEIIKDEIANFLKKQRKQ